MMVSELIEKLQTLPPDAEVRTWDAYADFETEEVKVSTNGKGVVYVMDTTIGYPEI